MELFVLVHFGVRKSAVTALVYWIFSTCDWPNCHHWTCDVLPKHVDRGMILWISISFPLACFEFLSTRSVCFLISGFLMHGLSSCLISCRWWPSTAVFGSVWSSLGLQRSSSTLPCRMIIWWQRQASRTDVYAGCVFLPLGSINCN